MKIIELHSSIIVHHGICFLCLSSIHLNPTVPHEHYLGLTTFCLVYIVIFANFIIYIPEQLHVLDHVGILILKHSSATYSS